MSTTEPPTTESPAPPPPPPPPGRRSWASRVGSRGFVIGAAIVVGVLVGGVVAALLIPDRDGFGPGFGRGDRVSEMDQRGGPWQGEGPWQGGPWRGGDHGDGGERGPLGLGDDPVVAGTVASVGNGTMAVTVDGGAQRTLRTDGDTRVIGEGNSALGDLQTGERVVVRVQGTGDAATAVTVWTPQARVIGTVTALTGDQATVTSVEGLTVSADVSALSQKPAVGDVVVLSGVATDGTTIRAEGIRVLPRAS
jgi:hypothetical protein